MLTSLINNLKRNVPKNDKICSFKSYNVMRSSFLKSLVLVGFSTSLIYLSACGERDAQNNLLGTWVVATIINSSCTDSADDGITTLTCSAEDCTRLIFTEGAVYEFQFTESGATRRDSGTIRIDGNTIDFCGEEDVSVCDRFSFSVNRTTLVLTFFDDRSGCQIRTTYIRG